MLVEGCVECVERLLGYGSIDVLDVWGFGRARRGVADGAASGDQRTHQDWTQAGDKALV